LNECEKALANYIEQEDMQSKEKNSTVDIPLDLNEIPSRNFPADAIHETSSLYEATQGFSDEGTEILYVSGQATTHSGEIRGVITLAAIENYYKPVEFRNAVD